MKGAWLPSMDYTGTNPSVKSAPEIVVYPNPVHDQLNLVIGVDNFTSGRIALFNASGMPVIETVRQLVSGRNRIGLSLNGLPRGIYLVSVVIENHSPMVQKIIRN